MYVLQSVVLYTQSELQYFSAISHTEAEKMVVIVPTTFIFLCENSYVLIQILLQFCLALIPK